MQMPEPDPAILARKAEIVRKLQAALGERDRAQARRRAVTAQ